MIKFDGQFVVKIHTEIDELSSESVDDTRCNFARYSDNLRELIHRSMESNGARTDVSVSTKIFSVTHDGSGAEDEGENVSWLLTCPPTNINFKNHLKAAAAEVSRAMAQVEGKVNSKTKMRMLSRALAEKLREA